MNTDKIGSCYDIGLKEKITEKCLKLLQQD